MTTWLQRFDTVLRHPLTLTFVGFLLTGLLGTYLTTLLHKAEIERTLVDAQRERGITAIQEIGELINERRTRAVMVGSAIKRHSAAEVAARKLAYDDVYVRWNTKEDGILNQVQEFLRIAALRGNRDYVDNYARSFRTALTSRHPTEAREGELREDRSRGGLLSRMDDCVTIAFDYYRRTEFGDPEPAKAALQACRFDDLDDRMIDCTHLLTAQLYDIVNHLGDAGHIRSTNDPLKQNIWEIEGGCRLP